MAAPRPSAAIATKPINANSRNEMALAHKRWVIVALLGAATTVNYIDRQTLSILSPLLRHELHLSEQDYANVVTAFLISYTVMYSGGGRIMDAIGVRLG